MSKITEQKLHEKVMALRERMAAYEEQGDGSMTPNPRALFPDASPTSKQRHADPTNTQGYNVKPAPVTPEPPPTAPPVTPEKPVQQQQQPVTQNAQTQGTQPQGTQQPEGWWDRVKGAADYLVHNPAQVIGGVAADVMNTGDNLAKGYNASRQPDTSNGAPKVSAKSNTTGGAPAGWPQGDAAIRAFQQANGLKVDGMIGANTMAALQKQGVQPPAGFKPVANKQGGAAAGSAPQAGQVLPNGSVSSGDAERDERLAQFGQVAQMSPDQQHMFNMGSAAQDAKAAGHPMDPASVARAAQPYGKTPATQPAPATATQAAPAANAQKSAYDSSALGQMQRSLQQQEAGQSVQTAPPTTKAPVGGQMQSTGDPVKDSELANQGNTIVYKEDLALARIIQLARG